MLRALVRRGLVCESAEIVDSLSLQVRWRRKPRWLGTAKTKVFRVPERPVEDPEERALMYKESSIYRTQMKAIRAFLTSEVERNEAKTSVLHKSDEQIQSEWDEAVAKNAVWNAECARAREARLAREFEEKQKYVLQKLENKERRKERMREKVEAAVLAQKTQVPTFITEKNIDEAIEHALVNPTDYNFALDLDGNIFKGGEGHQPKLPGSGSSS